MRAGKIVRVTEMARSQNTWNYFWEKKAIILNIKNTK